MNVAAADAEEEVVDDDDVNGDESVDGKGWEGVEKKREEEGRDLMMLMLKEVATLHIAITTQYSLQFSHHTADFL